MTEQNKQNLYPPVDSILMERTTLRLIKEDTMLDDEWEMLWKKAQRCEGIETLKIPDMAAHSEDVLGGKQDDIGIDWKVFFKLQCETPSVSYEINALVHNQNFLN